MANPKTVLPHIHRFSKALNQPYPRICIDCGAMENMVLPDPETLPDVTYIPVAPDDYDELIRKADLYNELKAVIERLSCEIKDLKRRFV